MSLLCLPSAFLHAAATKEDISAFFMCSIGQRKRRLTYVRQLVVDLLDSNAPPVNAFADFRTKLLADKERHPMFDIVRAMLASEWSPPSRKGNTLKNWDEFGASIISLYLVTSENMHRASAEEVARACAVENDMVNGRFKSYDADAEARDFHRAADWACFRDWIAKGALSNVYDIVEMLEQAVNEPPAALDQVKLLVKVLNGGCLQPPPGHELKADRERRLREEAAAALAASEAAAAAGADPLDEGFPPVRYEPGEGPLPAFPATRASPSPEPASPVLTVAGPTYQAPPATMLPPPALSRTASVAMGPMLPPPTLSRTASFVVDPMPPPALSRAASFATAPQRPPAASGSKRPREDPPSATADAGASSE